MTVLHFKMRTKNKRVGVQWKSTIGWPSGQWAREELLSGFDHLRSKLHNTSIQYWSRCWPRQFPTSSVTIIIHSYEGVTHYCPIFHLSMWNHIFYIGENLKIHDCVLAFELFSHLSSPWVSNFTTWGSTCDGLHCDGHQFVWHPLPSIHINTAGGKRSGGSQWVFLSLTVSLHQSHLLVSLCNSLSYLPADLKQGV